MRAVLYSFLFYFILGGVYSQRSVMRHFDTKNGLPSNEVYQLLSDSKGYIWICTDAGLVKYNGNTFKHFNSANGMPDNTIFQVKEDRLGRIWYISYAGKIGYISNDSVHVIDLGKEIEKYVTNGLITTIAFDKSNALYIGRRNLEHISFLKVSPPYGVKNISTIWKEERSGLSIHIIDQQDFVFCDARPDSARFEYNIRLYDNDKIVLNRSEPLNVDVLFTRAYMKEGSLYLVFGKELLKFDTKTGAVKKRSSSNNLVTVTNIEPGTMIIGESRMGIAYVNEDLEPLNKPRELEGQTVTYVVKDYQGGTWISTLESGVFYVPKQSVSFLTVSDIANEKIVKVIKTSDSSLIIAVNTGKLFQLNFGKNGPALSVLFDNKNGELSPPYSIFIDNKAKILASSSNHSFYLDFGTGKLRNTKNDVRINTLNAITTSKNEHLYLGLSGVAQIEEVGGKLIKRFYKSDDRLSSIAYYAKTNTILVGGLRGLYNFKFQQIHSDNNILDCRTEDIKFDKAGRTFVATRAHGLIILSDGKKNDTISEKDGLISNICKSLTIDSEFVWVCTNAGISRIKYDGVSTPSIYNYEIENFLGPTSANNLFSLSNKAIFYSGRSLYWFDKKNEASPVKLELISVNVGNTTYDPGKPLFLKHDPPDIKIYFEALLYNLGGSLEYRYRLNENEPWTNTKSDVITLAKLSPGEYKVEIQVMNKEGDWVAFDQPVKMIIDKAFYQKTWFIILLVLTIGSLIFFVVKKRYNKILKTEREKNELKINMLELESKAVKAQMNPHFIFNSLNSIQQFILADENENAYIYLTKFSKLVRKLLESTTTEDLTLEDETDLLNRYIEIEGLRFEDSFSYDLYVDPQLKPSSTRIPHMIIQPFVENAIWHGLLHTKGERKLKISFIYLNEKCVNCLVDDSGVGRMAKEHEIQTKASLATEFTKKRLELINKLKNSDCGFEIIDKTMEKNGETGTIVDIKIPIMN